MFSACFLFSVKRQVPAVSSTAVKGAQVHLMQQEEYMTVSLKKKVWILREDTGARRYIIISKRSTFGNAAREE
jgi:hypothetical protein